MGKKQENTSFVCAVCKEYVSPLRHGSYRNHCPFCLTSLHVDHVPGDRTNTCRGVMDAIGVTYSTKKGWQLIHKCQKCGQEKVNRIAIGDTEEDNWDLIIQLSQRETLP